MDNEITPQVVDGSRQLAIEIKAQRDLALAKPRDEAAIFKRAMMELELAPEFAEDAYYSIPYSKRDQESGEKVTELVEGVSVKASRAITRIWSNCAAAARIASESDESVECEGIFADFETNVFFRATFRVSKTYIPSKSKIPVPLIGTHLTNAIQAGLSKAERNATLKGIPEYFKIRYFEAAKKIAGQKGKAEGKSIQDRLTTLFAQFEKLGVKADRVKAHIEERWKEPTDEMFGTMRGVFNALKDKQTTIDEAFPVKSADPKKDAVNLNDIAGANL